MRKLTFSYRGLAASDLPSWNGFLGVPILVLPLLVSAPVLAGEAEWKANMGAGMSAYSAGDYRVATARFEAALREAESFGASDPRLATTLNNLAELYREQGRYTDAGPLYQHSLGIWEKALGSDHPDVATTLNNLAGLYRTQGRYAEAEPLYRRSLGIREKVMGPDHGDVAASLNNLGGLYEAQGRYSEAEPLYWRTLAIAEKALGPDHPHMGTTLNNLAGLYQKQGRYAEAEPLYRRSLRIYEKALGAEHPDVARSLDNLAVLYRTQGRYAEAEPLYHRALGIREKALGPDHPNVGTTLNNLARLYQSQARFAEAEPMYRRDLTISEKALGPDHPDVGTTLNNLAGLYEAQGRYAEAEPLYRRSLGIREKVLGPEHPDVGTSLNNLAFLYQSQGKVDDALVLTRRANASLAKRFMADSRRSRQSALSEQRARSDGFEMHISLLATVAQRGAQARTEATREGFGIAQLARTSDTAEQVAKMAARYAAGSDALAQLARARQDAMARFEQLDSRMVQAAGQRSAEGIAAKLRDEQAETLKAIVELDARLEREYPQYRELTNPKPLELAAAQKLLAEDEALVLLLVSADAPVATSNSPTRGRVKLPQADRTIGIVNVISVCAQVFRQLPSIESSCLRIPTRGCDA